MGLRTYYIYALLDPETWEMFYVGQTRNPAWRVWYHIRELDREIKTPKQLKLKEIVERNQKPCMMILCENIASKDIHRVEAQYIAEMRRAGHKLTNSTKAKSHQPSL